MNALLSTAMSRASHTDVTNKKDQVTFARAFLRGAAELINSRETPIKKPPPNREENQDTTHLFRESKRKKKRRCKEKDPPQKRTVSQKLKNQAGKKGPSLPVRAEGESPRPP